MGDAVSWGLFQTIKITEETTTSSSRIFIKVIFRELSEQWGVKKLSERLSDPEQAPFFANLFPKDHPKNMRFSINFFTAIGLGVLTEDLRHFLETNGQAMMEAQRKQALGSDSDDDSDSDSSSSSSSS